MVDLANALTKPIKLGNINKEMLKSQEKPISDNVDTKVLEELEGSSSTLGLKVKTQNNTEGTKLQNTIDDSIEVVDKPIKLDNTEIKVKKPKEVVKKVSGGLPSNLGALLKQQKAPISSNADMETLKEVEGFERTISVEPGNIKVDGVKVVEPVKTEKKPLPKTLGEVLRQQKMTLPSNADVDTINEINEKEGKQSITLDKQEIKVEETPIKITEPLNIEPVVITEDKVEKEPIVVDKYSEARLDKGFEDLVETTSFDSKAPSSQEDFKTGIIKSVANRIEEGYPLLYVKLDTAEQMSRRKLDSIFSLLDTVTNDEEVIQQKGLIRFGFYLKTKAGIENKKIQGVLEPSRLSMMMYLIEEFDVECYLSATKQISRSNILALSII